MELFGLTFGVEKTCLIHQVTVLQLEKLYGKSSDAKSFIQEIIKGQLAELCGNMCLNDESWAQSKCIDYFGLNHFLSGQKGTPHPQAGQSPPGSC